MTKKELLEYILPTITSNLQYDNLVSGDEISTFGDDEFQFTDRDGATHLVKVTVE